MERAARVVETARNARLPNARPGEVRNSERRVPRNNAVSIELAAAAGNARFTFASARAYQLEELRVPAFAKPVRRRVHRGPRAYTLFQRRPVVVLAAVLAKRCELAF